MDLRIPENRKKILEEIKTPENRDRKDASLLPPKCIMAD